VPQIQIVRTGDLDDPRRNEILTLCRAAYREDLDGYLENIGPGVHLLGRVEGTLVSHAMFVERWLQLHDGRLLRTGYVELVATAPAGQRRGYASALMRRVADEIHAFDIGALSPTDERIYARLGWQTWRGPLLVRTGTSVVTSQDEGLMILRLPRTPADLSLDEPISIEWRPGEVW
jgi:aminoglycoside 2'-N-acetyltransferase I